MGSLSSIDYKRGLRSLNPSLTIYFYKGYSLPKMSVNGDIMQSAQEWCNMGLKARKPVLRVYNNKGTDQPAHLRRLINAFVIHFLERIIWALM